MKIYRHLQGNVPKGWEAEFADSDEGILESCQRLERDKVDYLPKEPNVFLCYELTPKLEVKAVIVGQSAYHTPGLAHGLAFSSMQGIPPSLKTIYKELAASVDGWVTPTHGNLTKWAQQGVLLMNVSPTAKRGVADYLPLLWMSLVDSVVNGLTKSNRNIVWMLWGAKAQKLTKLIGDKGIKLLAAHPSPVNTHGGFIGCNHFNLCNQHLIKLGVKPVDWSL